MKEILNSIRMQLLERLNSPLSGAFVISWICWNYRMLFVLFSSLPVNDRFTFIDTVLYKTPNDRWLMFLLYPAGTAAAFILFYPFLSQAVFWYWHKQKEMRLKAIRDRIENATLLTLEESREVRLLVATKQVEYEETITRQSRELETLKKSLTDQMIQYNNLATSRKTEAEQQKAKEPNEGTIRLLKLLAKQADGRLYNHVLPGMLSEPPQKINYYFDEGARLELMTNGYNGDRVQYIQITAKGRAYAVQQQFI